MTITAIQMDAFLSLFWFQLFIFSIFGLLVGSFIRSLYKRAVRLINIPKKIKTNYGILYRADNGFYVEKHLLEKLNLEYAFKNKQRAIALYKRRINLLESELVERVSTSEPCNQNSKTSSL